MLHVANGAITASFLEKSGLSGDVVAWGDMLMEGAVPNGLASRRDWDHRARDLEARYGIPRLGYLATMDACLAAIARARGEDEVVLWFEDDVFCFLHLAFIVDRLHVAGVPDERVTIVNTVTPLNETPADGFVALFEGRRNASPAASRVLRRAWRAYADPDPRALELLASSSVSAWPFARDALLALLARFPSTRNGLSVVENTVLDALAEGPLTLTELFARVTRVPACRVYGMPDVAFEVHVRALAGLSFRLVDVAEGAAGAVAAITDPGRAVAAGRADAVARNGIDRMLGAVRLLKPGAVWRWNGSALESR